MMKETDKTSTLKQCHLVLSIRLAIRQVFSLKYKQVICIINTTIILGYSQAQAQCFNKLLGSSKALRQLNKKRKLYSAYLFVLTQKVAKKGLGKKGKAYPNLIRALISQNNRNTVPLG